MGDRFDVAVLDNLLLNENLTLTSKRAFLHVNHFFNATTLAHLTHQELHVRYHDCTIANSRFVMRVLMPRVPGLLVCALGEQFVPKMDLAKLQKLQNVRVSTTTARMGYTASFFLGHALAQQDCCVRLSTGKKKSLTALRMRGRIYLTPDERVHDIDCNLVAGALLANVETRLAEYAGHVLLLDSLYIDRHVVRYLFPLLTTTFAIRGAPAGRLDLAHNPLGSPGVKAMLLALMNTPTNLKEPNFRLQEDIALGPLGMPTLLHVMNSGVLNVGELYLDDVGLTDDAMEILVAALRPPHGTAHTGLLRVLDVNDNPFGDAGMRALMVFKSLPCLKILHLRKLTRVSKRAFVDLGTCVRDGLFPAIQDIYTDSFGPKSVPMHTAVKWWVRRREMRQCAAEWSTFVTEFEQDEALRATARKQRRVSN